MELFDRHFADEPGAGERWDLVVVDRRATGSDELVRLSRLGTPIGIDEGGEAREMMPYLIDTLPLPARLPRANCSSSAYQARPARRRAPGEAASGKVIVSFGGEDPGGLSSKMITALLEGNFFTAEQITLVVGPLFHCESLPRDVARLDAPSDLRERLHEFDILFTSFGRTAYEAVNAGISVVLFNPSRYHRTLSRIAGFPEIGVRRVRRRRLRRILSDRDELRSRCSRLAPEHQESISDRLEGLEVPLFDRCPVCGENKNMAIGRFPDRSFFRCRRCSMVYELDFSKGQRRYDKAYFFEDYRAQYGRTYLEDFDSIRDHAAGRIARLRAIGTPVADKRVLDVGCAFGPFLVEASRAGGRVLGIDVAHDAVEYVRNNLGLPCERLSLEDLDLDATFGTDTVDIVTMWYVIEHLPQLGRMLAKINTLLPLGGVFAFSTPNLHGISGRSNPQKFLANSPYDHFTLWDPRIARRVLRLYGFQVREVQITGHHPERFPVVGAAAGWRYSLLRRYSVLARLGDTFECYTVKVSELDR